MFNTIKEAIEDIKQGKMIIVVDDQDRENEGDLVCAAEKVTPEIINFMIKHGRGLVCLPILGQRLDDLHINLMTAHNSESKKTAFTVSIDATKDFGVTTGISPQDRAATIKVMLDPKTKSSDLNRPGHIFPLRAEEGGVLKRAGHTEAGVDLARIAGFYPAGVICEIIKDNGDMARIDDLKEFAKKHNLKMVTIADLISYRLKKEKMVKKIEEVNLPTEHGFFKAIGYENILDGDSHIALVMGDISGQKDVLVRVHSECLTGDVFHSQRCDCGEQLSAAMKMVAREKKGVILYMRQEGRGIGLMNKLRAYKLQDGGADTVEANEKLGFKPDLRDYGIGAQILADLGLTTIKLLTNNPRKVIGLEGYGLQIVERIPIEVEPNDHNIKYIKTKNEKLGHLFTINA